jgi:hypothetical protein
VNPRLKDIQCSALSASENPGESGWTELNGSDGK